AMPLWISDLHRGNLLEEPALAAQVREGSEREGSSTGMLFIETLDWRQEAGVTTLVLGAGQVASVCELLPLRLRHGRSLELVSRERQWEFVANGGGEAADVSADSARWSLDEAGLQALAGVRAERGVYPLAGALRIEVMPTYLRDANGEVIRQIG
ncbi:suppressor of fused domain protein, partial [Klebsiella pneumoniae]|nr:suppressor of fused domain protein [Klebsiella pneumoniae]